MPGFTKGRKLDKIGLKVQDAAELAFSDVRVPAANLLSVRRARPSATSGATCRRSG